MCYVCLAESRPGHLSHHYNTRAGERGGLQQALHGLFRGDPNQKARGEDQHLLSVRPFRLRGVGVHRRGHPDRGGADLRAEPHPGGAGAERGPAQPLGVLHAAQCHLGGVRSLRPARYSPTSPLPAPPAARQLCLSAPGHGGSSCPPWANVEEMPCSMFFISSAEQKGER